MIAVVTDSNAQLPPELATRFDVEIVPLTVTIDGTEYAEGVDLDADEFFARLQNTSPQVSTSQPSPGRFLATYQRAADRGASAILSIHIGSAISGTVNSARLAAAASPIPVHIVDTGTASFAVACCVWEAGETLARGEGLAAAAAAAHGVSTSVGNVFTVRGLELARAGGRLDTRAEAEALAIPVLTLSDGAMRTIGEAADVTEAADLMASHVQEWASSAMGGGGLRVGVAVADTETLQLVEALEYRLGELAEVSEIVRYRVGPSVAVHTGAGTVGAMYYPIPALV